MNEMVEDAMGEMDEGVDTDMDDKVRPYCVVTFELTVKNF